MRTRPSLGMILLTGLLIGLSGVALGMDVIVYTAHQSWDSRIYILDMSGAVIDYFEYEFYRLMDLEVVDNEIYIAEAFAPRGLKFNLYTGDLDVVIDDWSLYYFYDVAFDGSYFYVTEWDLNRYDINGNKNGTASFAEDVLGSCHDGTYYWTLDDTNLIKCWDLTGWPALVELTENHFTPPSPDCRGLWFDGTYFWTAEAKDTLGYIFQFGYDGVPVHQWLEPAFQGWSAVVVSDYVSAVDGELPDDAGCYRLLGNHPNPFNPSTDIRFEVPVEVPVRLRSYSLTGQLITTLVDRTLAAGKHHAVWTGSADTGQDVASGTYIYRLQAGDFVATKSMTLLK